MGLFGVSQREKDGVKKREKEEDGNRTMATGTEYEKLAVKNRASIDNLIGMVSQVALNNILLVVIDECQNVCRNKGGVNLIASMTQLICCRQSRRNGGACYEAAM